MYVMYYMQYTCVSVALYCTHRTSTLSDPEKKQPLTPKGLLRLRQDREWTQH